MRISFIGLLAAMSIFALCACGKSSTPLGVSGQTTVSLPGDVVNPGIEASRMGTARLPGVDVVRHVLRAKQTTNVDELNLPDLTGAYDALIPVRADYPLPEVPSQMHDVSTMRNGRYLRPRIPGARLSGDGRVGVGFISYKGSSLGLPVPGFFPLYERYLSFTLYTPEKLQQKGTHYLLANDGSTDMMSDEVSYVAFSELIPATAPLRPLMFAVCDSTRAELDHELYLQDGPAVHRNPYPVSATAEAYDLTLIAGNLAARQEIFSFVVRIVVENAKTPKAYIKSIQKVGEPVVAKLSFTPLTHFEPNVTGDGRLLVFRTSGTPGQGGGSDALQPMQWTDNEGVVHKDQFDIVYAYNPPDSGFPACDPRGWSNLRPISYAHYDPPVRDHYGFAKFPFRSPEGETFTPGQETGMTYPWIDSRGANLFFTAEYRLPISDESTFVTNEDAEMVESVVPEATGTTANISELVTQVTNVLPASASAGMRPPLMLPAAHIKPLPGGCDGCRDSTAREHASSTRGVGVAGLWTQGKMVVLDGLINASDFGYQAFDDGQRLLRLYHGSGGVVQVGNGRSNVDVAATDDIDSYWPLNDSMIESQENRFNMFSQFRPAAPQDVVWTVITGRVSSEVPFDDYMDTGTLIVSNMTASYLINQRGPIKWLVPATGDRAGRPFRLQNLATNLNVPPYGAVIGDYSKGTRIEPVALGGVDGKGFWMTESVGVRYTVPAAYKPADATGVFYGLFVDYRMDLADGNRYRLLTTPNGTVTLVGTKVGPRLEVASGDWSTLVDLGPTLVKGAWGHIGLERRDRKLTVFANGFQLAEVDVGAAPNLLAISAGDIVLGSPSSVVPGIRGWVDDLKVIARPLLNLEEPCNVARGSMVKATAARGAIADRYPVAAHARVGSAIGEPAGSRYACAVDYRSEHYGFLTLIPESERIGKRLKGIKQLKYGTPRPSELDNGFCKSCHFSPHPSASMSLDALVLRSLPAQLDPRRQPLQPYPVVIGLVPPLWNESNGERFPKTAEVNGAPGKWLELDRYLLPAH